MRKTVWFGDGWAAELEIRSSWIWVPLWPPAWLVLGCPCFNASTALACTWWTGLPPASWDLLSLSGGSFVSLALKSHRGELSIIDMLKYTLLSKIAQVKNGMTLLWLHNAKLWAWTHVTWKELLNIWEDL